MSERPTDDHAAAALQILPITGLPRFAEGDDLATAIAHAAPWLVDDDIVVVTSKVFSKVEGRMVAAPTDPDERDRLRRTLIADETVRIVARRGRTLITENRNGLVQAAAGVDGSNVETDQLALLPVDPDASAADLRAALADRLGVRVAVIVTDTMGRAWRTGQTDVAIGASGIEVSRAYDGVVDGYGNTLQVTDIAIADEIAAAADLVKGKLGNIPVAVVRGYSVVDNGSRATDLVRPGESDMFYLGTTEAMYTGRIHALRTRTSVREFVRAPVPADDMYAAFGDALTAPAPHHTRPVRFVWVRDPDRRRRLLDAMAEQWRADLRADGLSDDAIERRVARGDILYRAPELVIPVMVPDGAHSYPDNHRTAAEHTMFTVAVGAAVQALLVALSVRGIGSCWIGSTIFAPDITREILDLDELGPQTYPLGAIAIGYPDRLTGLRPAATTDGLVVQR